MPVRVFLIIVCLSSMFAACAPERPEWVPPRPGAGAGEKPHTRQAVHKGHPKVDGQEVRDWFSMVSFPGWKRLSIFSEFHPDEGSFVARYGKGPKILYLSYIDNQRMSQFGLQRSAVEILQTGRKGRPDAEEIAGLTWYGVDDEQPLLAVDVTEDVKLVLMGYQGLDLDELKTMAKALPVEALRARAER